jgi:hypothetical protein
MHTAVKTSIHVVHTIFLDFDSRAKRTALGVLKDADHLWTLTDRLRCVSAPPDAPRRVERG